MKIALISFNDIDVTTGVTQLLDKYKGKVKSVIVPIVHDTEKFYGSIIKVCLEKDVKITYVFASAEGLDHILKNAEDLIVADNPVKEVIRQLGATDALGVVWDDSPQAHFAVHAVEDLAIDTWDVTSGVTKIEIDFDDDEDDYLNMSSEELREAVHDSITGFVDVMAAYIAGLVMDSLSQAVSDSITKRTIDPFDAEDLD